MVRKSGFSADDAKERRQLKHEMLLAVDRFVRGQPDGTYLSALLLVHRQLKASAKIDAGMKIEAVEYVEAALSEQNRKARDASVGDSK